MNMSMVIWMLFKKKRKLLKITFFIYLLSTFVLLPSIYGNYLVGFSHKDITPTLQELESGQIYLGGYGFAGSRGKANSILDPVGIRSCIINDGKQKIVLSIMDTTGVSNKIIAAITKEVSSRTSIPITNILIGATHTHSGPDLQGLWGGVSEAYKKRIIKININSILEAIKLQQPAKLLISQTKAPAQNRRDWGYTDNDLIFIKFINPNTQKRIFSLISFAAHPTLLDGENRGVSSDFIHFTRSSIATNTGSPVLYVSGALGDVIPTMGSRGYEVVKKYGELLGNKAISLKKFTQITDGIFLKTQFFKQKINNKFLLTAYWLNYLDYEIEGSFFEKYMNTRLSYFRLGKELQVAVLPGEPLTRLGLYLKQKMKSPFKMVIGLTGDTLGYLIPQDEWNTNRNNNYEEKISVHKKIGDETRDRILKLISN